MKEIFIFLGPSLPIEEARLELDAVFLPPVAQGDVYRAARRHPAAIGIIDGYFERVPAVWHKEILWAMTQGVHVFGASSMGALRAAELHAFGMEGAGLIFEAFRDGDLEDDDEVAVAHAMRENDYRSISEAMVNIRCTLGEAEAAGVLAPATHAKLIKIAKREYYPERSYPLLLEKASATDLPPSELSALRDWLPAHRVDQKRDDALALLRHLRERAAAGWERKQTSYECAHTDMWDSAMLRAGAVGFDDADAASETRVLDELRLRGETYLRAREATTARILAVEETHRQNLTMTAEMLHRTGDEFRRRRDLIAPEAVRAWMEEQHLDADAFNRLLEDETRIRWIEEMMRTEIAYRLPDHLRMSGEYGALLQRAREKQQALRERGHENPGLAELGLEEDELWEWFFARRLEQPMPEDLEGYARALDFEHADDLRRAVLREYCFALER
jgi:hypothetical protein